MPMAIGQGIKRILNHEDKKINAREDFRYPIHPLARRDFGDWPKDLVPLILGFCVI
jgi:hypothetical protein